MPKKKYFINPYTNRRCFYNGPTHRRLLKDQANPSGRGFFDLKRSRKKKKPRWDKYVVYSGKGRTLKRSRRQQKGGLIPLAFIPPLLMLTAGFAGPIYGKLRKKK